MGRVIGGAVESLNTHAFRGDRRRRVPGRGLPRAARGRDVRRRDDRTTGFRGAWAPRRRSRRAHDGSSLDHATKPANPLTLHHPPWMMRSAGLWTSLLLVMASGARATVPHSSDSTNRARTMTNAGARSTRGSCVSVGRAGAHGAHSRPRRRHRAPRDRAGLAARDVIARAFDGDDHVADVRAPLTVLLVVVVARAAIAWYTEVSANRASSKREVAAASRARREARRRSRRPLAGRSEGHLTTLADPWGRRARRILLARTCLSWFSR